MSQANQSRASPAPKNLRQAALSTDIARFSEGGAPAKVPLHPFGSFRGNNQDFVFDEKSQEAIRLQKADRGADWMVDWHHQELDREAGLRDDAPAGAWITDVVVEDGFVYGIVGDWTPRAAQAVRDKEIRYISAVFNYDSKTGRVLRYHSFGLVNRPGTHHQRRIGLAEAEVDVEVHGAADSRQKALSVSFGDIHRMLADVLRERFGDEAWTEEVFDEYIVYQLGGQLYRIGYRIEDDKIVLEGAFLRVKKDYIPIPEEEPMDERLKALLTALGLAEDATQEQMTEALSALQGRAALGDQAAQITGLSEVADTLENRGVLMALAQTGDNTAELASLTAQLEEVTGDRAERLVTQALSVGKITTPQKDYWVKQATRDYGAAQAYLNSAPQVVPVASLADAVKTDTATAALEQGQEDINSLLGVNVEAFRKYNGGD